MTLITQQDLSKDTQPTAELLKAMQSALAELRQRLDADGAPADVLADVLAWLLRARDHDGPDLAEAAMRSHTRNAHMHARHIMEQLEKDAVLL